MNTNIANIDCQKKKTLDPLPPYSIIGGISHPEDSLYEYCHYWEGPWIVCPWGLWFLTTAKLNSDDWFALNGLEENIESKQFTEQYTVLLLLCDTNFNVVTIILYRTLMSFENLVFVYYVWELVVLFSYKNVSFKSHQLNNFYCRLSMLKVCK